MQGNNRDHSTSVSTQTISRKLPFQFDSKSAFAVVLIAAIIFASVRVVVGVIGSAFQKTVVLSGADWEYRATIRIVNAVTVLESEVTWKGLSIPAKLLKEGVTITTPIGSFSRLNDQWYPHASDPPWWSDHYTVETPEPGVPWVRQIDDQSRFDQMNEGGWYATPVEGLGSSSDWSEVQLMGTPHDWVHVSAGSKHGYWADPTALQSIMLK